MAYVWRNDFKSGIERIDDEYNEIYRIFNAFAADENKVATCEAAHLFATELLPHATTLFETEEKMMNADKYPLINIHTAFHKKIVDSLNNISDAAGKNNLENPHETVVGIAKIWLNEHHANDDATFYSFCKNKGKILEKNLKNMVCTISTMNDKLITSGMIKSTESNNLLIELADNSKLKILPGDMVKISAKSSFGRVQTIIAKIGKLEKNKLIMFNASIIDASHSRAVFRVNTKIAARILLAGSNVSAVITNISSGGLMITAEKGFKKGDIINIEFMIQNHRIIEPSEIMRVTTDESGKILYNLKFVAIDHKDQEKIDAYVLNKQIMTVR